ncbi:DUF72 domain-containing protein [Taibaiella lutea]|uniref:DUF72 domain-containing protein n=1 Tax=Taibaiella lutea TaxID=2608001 RepID=A0A5M6CSZ2_9BACT|nr:DUF72 domain-containing protein [Taibaiella lutea]KAA5536155.1 DUF72 domain-containing protein [Taibaiella lutea]
MKLKGIFYAGTSGLQLPIPKSAYPENYRDKSRLVYYSSLYNSVEINSSFYKLPQAKTIGKWIGEIGDDFRISLKAWQNITHVKALDFLKGDIEKFLAIIPHPENKIGCLLFQFPPGLQASAKDQLFHLLDIIRSNENSVDWKIATEFRHYSWYGQINNEQLKPYNATIVIHDMHMSATPFVNKDTGFLYLRFHGPDGKYRGSYDDAFLQEKAALVKQYLSKGKDVYAYFNNTMGNALGNLDTFMRMVQK